VTSTADVVVIGAGIVGLALADALLAARPGSSVVVLDKEHRLGAHASGRNSGVLHAGFYYTPDSLKARLTRRGNVLLHEFCDQHGVPVRRCGKLVVARRPEDLPTLDELVRRAALNGVPVEAVDEAQARELEPLARTVERALWSPTTSSASPTAVVDALAGRVRERGGEVVLGSPVVTAREGAVVTPETVWSVGHVVNAAGLQADRVARWFGMCDDYAVLPFKGLYWYGDRGRWAPGRQRRHVYPVPDPRNPFLGVHLTVTVDGRAKIGPTALPALWRESYGGLHGLAPGDVVDVVHQLPRLLTSRHHDVPRCCATSCRRPGDRTSSVRRPAWSPASRRATSANGACPASAPSCSTWPTSASRWTSWCAATSTRPTCSTRCRRRGRAASRSPSTSSAP
jgi:(S)-2-hydroxyglutarate dehydrogenase